MYTFKELGIKNKRIEVLRKQGIKTPTQIQEMSIEPILNKKDVIAEAPTGTGKTLAFLLPIMEGIKLGNDLKGLIVTPTRELAIQIAEEAEKINTENINIMTVYGGKDYSKQLKTVDKSVDLIIATPGRLVDFIKQGLVKLDKLQTLVLDEVDQTLLMGFQKEIELILNKTNKKRQTLCYSATLTSQVKKIAYRFTKEPMVITVKNNDINTDNIKKFLVETTDRWKIDALATMLNKTNPFMAIIFCRTKVRVDRIEQKLEERGYNVQKLHSDVPQVKREKIIKSFKKAEIQYLVATDVASRGLDITGVTHIFNLDIPEKAETYIHRIGRTARAGESGEAYLFTDPKDKRLLLEIEDKLGHKLEKLEFDGEREVRNTNETFTKKYNKKIKSRVGERK